MYLASERHEYILKTVNERGAVRTTVLAREMNVTDETVRNDLIMLERMGLLEREHGGARSSQKKILNETLRVNVSNDVTIAKAASGYILNDDNVFLDGGPLGNLTVSYLHQKPVTIVTNSPSIITRLEVHKNVKAYCTGGYLDRETGLLTGIQAAESLSMMGLNTAMIIPDGFCVKRGPAYASQSQADFIKILMKQAQRTIVLCPGEKLGATSSIYLGIDPAIKTLITNSDAPEEIVTQLKDGGIEVIIA